MLEHRTLDSENRKLVLRHGSHFQTWTTVQIFHRFHHLPLFQERERSLRRSLQTGEITTVTRFLNFVAVFVSNTAVFVCSFWSITLPWEQSWSKNGWTPFHRNDDTALMTKFTKMKSLRKKRCIFAPLSHILLASQVHEQHSRFGFINLMFKSQSIPK